jgi:hypothetical protein
VTLEVKRVIALREASTYLIFLAPGTGWSAWACGPRCEILDESDDDSTEYLPNLAKFLQPLLLSKPIRFDQLSEISVHTDGWNHCSHLHRSLAKYGQDHVWLGRQSLHHPGFGQACSTIRLLFTHSQTGFCPTSHPPCCVA